MMKVEGTNCNSCVAKFVIFHSETKELELAQTGDETDNDPTNYGARCQSTPRFARAKNTKTEEICQRVANYKFWSWFKSSQTLDAENHSECSAIQGTFFDFFLKKN